MTRDLSIWTAERQAILLAKLECRPPSMRPIIAEPLRDIYARRVSRLIQVIGISMCLVLLAYIFSSHVSPKDNLRFFLSCVSVVSGFLMLAFFIIEFVETNYIFGFIKKFWAVPLTGEQADWIVKWSNFYPQVRMACIRWGAGRTTQNLNSIDYARLRKTCNEVDRLEYQLQEYQEKIALADHVLDNGGLLSKIRAASALAALDANVKPASGTGGAGRI
jgi:hypothetical protein